MTAIVKTPQGIVLENAHLACTIGFDGRVQSFVDRYSGQDCLAKRDDPFCYLLTGSCGSAVMPDYMEWNGEELIFGFASGAYLCIRPEVKQRYLSFEVTKTVGIACYGLVFASIVADYPLTDAPDAFGMSCLSMKLNTRALAWPSWKERRAGGTAFAESGMNGAKLALIGAPRRLHRDILKEIARDIPKGDAPVAYGTGGPWARDDRDERGDYIIVGMQDPETLRKNLPMYASLGIDQLDFHKGLPFRQGDFRFFTDETGTASAFREKMAAQLRPLGIKAGLHTYSFYIDPEASGLLSDPHWQGQLLAAEQYVLAEDMSPEATQIITEEATAHASRQLTVATRASEYLLIDRELIRITPMEEPYEYDRDGIPGGCKTVALAVGEQGFDSVTRGIAGTTPAEHKKGAKITRIAGFYGGLCPVIGSELFFEVARRTARAYNEGGFGMIYFDALDGIRQHLTDPTLDWYYAAAFVTETLRHTHDAPIVEMSFFDSPFYLARGRVGAWDYPRRGYKSWNRLHIRYNATMQDRYLNTLVGWYNLYPLAPEGSPPAAHVQYQFSDDIDHMGSLAIAHDLGMVYQNITAEALALPAVRRNTDRYVLYNRLRKENYFSEDMRRRLREGRHEYALVERDGRYGFVEKSYTPRKLRCVDDPDFNVTAHLNPFAPQKPFLRLEAFPITVGEDPITVIGFDETRELRIQPRRQAYEGLDARDHCGLHFRVFGNGSGDALLIRLQDTADTFESAYDYYVPLHFQGWKDFYIVDIDNTQYDPARFPDAPHGQEFDANGVWQGTVRGSWQRTLDFSKLRSVQVFLSGDCAGVRMSDIRLCRWQPGEVVDPTVTVGGEALTFRCTLRGGEYIEYAHGEAQIYDEVGGSRPVEEVRGSLTAPAGEFTAVTTRKNPGAPAAMRLTFGFTGAQVY